jgi:hypothetical protein
MKKVTRYILIFLSLFQAGNLSAWIYPEHRDIGMLAVNKLTPQDRVILDRLWAEARMGFESRLTDSVIFPEQGVKPPQLDFASWMGIAGDHSCSPENMLQTVLYSKWILKVADIAAMLKNDLKKAKNNSEIINAIRNSDIRFQRVDIDYATRAGSNSVHFLLERDSTTEDSQEYLQECMKGGGDLNALGAYVWFHSIALLKASEYSAGNLIRSQRSAIILAALADEAFALHFLEDAFASGHIAGTWGNSALKKGTHDYYNEKGLEVLTWDGKQMVAMGDAYMRQEDTDNAAMTIKMSLEQLISASVGKFDLKPASNYSVSTIPDTLNVCKNNYMPKGNLDYSRYKNILIRTPIPGLAKGAGALPRFRSEMGFFLGASTSVNGSTTFGGFGENQKKQGGIGGLEANLMIGYGLEGVLNESGDGLIFLQMGWRDDSPSTSQLLEEGSSVQTNSITSYIPGRSAYNIKLRLPFWLIPGDMIIAAPVLGILSPKTLQKMLVAAGNGGLIPWQSGIATSIGRFQFIAGREVSISLYGLGKTADALLVPQSDSTISLLTYRSTKLEFPFLEYRPMRSFSQDQTSLIKVQFAFGVDLPYKLNILESKEVTYVNLKPVWNVTMRILFNYRHYF